MKKERDDIEEVEERKSSAGKLFRRESDEKPWDDEPLEDVEGDDWPLVEYEDIEIEEDEEPEHRGGVLKAVIIAVVVLALLAVGFFLVRNFLRNRAGDDATTVVVSSEDFTDMDEEDMLIEEDGMTTEEDDMMMEDDMMTEDDMMSEDDMKMEDDAMSDSEGMEEDTIPLPTVSTAPTAVTEPAEEPAGAEPAETPAEVSAPKSYYDLSEIDTSDLSAVRIYIQGQLDAIATDLYCPNIDDIQMNDDGTVFTAVCNSINESLAEQEAVEKIYELGRTYAKYAGTTPGKIRIEYKNHMGDMLWTRESGS